MHEVTDLTALKIWPPIKMSLFVKCKLLMEKSDKINGP